MQAMLVAMLALILQNCSYYFLSYVLGLLSISNFQQVFWRSHSALIILSAKSFLQRVQEINDDIQKVDNYFIYLYVTDDRANESCFFHLTNFIFLQG